jgi:phosphohistidine phosphatase
VIYLLRHGDAQDEDGDDAARRLTALGERQARDAGQALNALGAEVNACLTSPKVRAAKTAELACEALEPDPEVADELANGHFDARALAAGRGSVLLVGHEPGLAAEVARLTGANVKMRKGGLAIVQESCLVSLLGHAELRRIV